MKLRKMTLDDVTQVAALEKACFSDPWSERSIASELNNPLAHWIVAAEDEEIVGYVGSQSVLDAADMMNIAVKEEYRRSGIAESLINRLLTDLAKMNVVSLSLEVRAGNTPAIELYKKLGFFQAGCRPNYYRNPKEDALILRKEWSV